MTAVRLVNSFYDTGIENGDFRVNRFEVEKARAIMLAYFLYYGEEWEDYEVVGVETPYSLPIPGLEDEKHAGFIDYILKRKRDGRLILCDLKTTSKIGRSYIDELSTNEQLSEYYLAMRQCGYDNIEVRWDIAAKPDIKPKKISKPMLKELESGAYCGLPLGDVPIPEDGEESPQLYGMRCLTWYLDKPSQRFTRVPITRSNEELLNHISNLSRRVQRVRSWESEDLLPVQHFEKCSRYTRMCDYHKICCGADPNRGFYKAKEAPKDRVKQEGFSVSRLRTSDTCPREYYHKYVEKIEPIVKADTSAVDLGSLVHQCFEHVLRTRLVDKPLVLSLGE